MEYVWYLSYGSNMFEERFLCYILGRKYKDNARSEQGCKDSSLPIDSKSVVINHELYFSKNSSRWQNGGVAFIDSKIDKQVKTYAKMYKITKEQFEDVIKQENRINVKEEIDIDYNKLNQCNEINLLNSWYGKLIKIGMECNEPVYSFTALEVSKQYEKPSKEYLNSLISGIKLNFSLTNDEILNYFINLKGVNQNYTTEQIKEIISWEMILYLLKSDPKYLKLSSFAPSKPLL